jgi:hypothetical protein
MIDLHILEEATEEHLNLFAEYADRHNVFNLFQDMLRQLLVAKPEKPLVWMANYLERRPGAYSENIDDAHVPCAHFGF